MKTKKHESFEYLLKAFKALKKQRVFRKYKFEFENGSYHPNEVSVNDAKQNLR